MAACGIARDTDILVQKKDVADACHADEHIPEQEPASDFGRRCAPDTDLQIKLSLPQWQRVLVRLGRKPQANPWCFFQDGCHQRRCNNIQKAFIGAKGECPIQRFQIQFPMSRA